LGLSAMSAVPQFGHGTVFRPGIFSIPKNSLGGHFGQRSGKP
jgi:hypothetical protein